TGGLPRWVLSVATHASSHEGKPGRALDPDIREVVARAEMAAYWCSDSAGRYARPSQPGQCRPSAPKVAHVGCEMTKPVNHTLPFSSVPQASGLYDPRFEHDACGVSFVVDIKGRKSHAIVATALDALCNLDHRG